MNAWNELLSELGTVNILHPDAMTTRELMTTTGKSQRWCIDRIREGVTRGILQPVRKSITDLSGRPTTVAAYQPAKKECKNVARRRAAL